MVLVEGLRQWLVGHGLTFVENNYIYALLFIILFTMLSKLVVFLTERIVLQFTRRTKNKLDDYIVEHTHKPLTWILIFIGIRLAIEVIGLVDRLVEIIYHINDTIIILIAAYIVMVVIDGMIDFWGKLWAKRTKSHLDDELLPLFHKFSKAAVWVIAFIIILAEWGVQIGPALAGLGIAGIAIGFAVKDSLGNIFGGISLILDRTIQVGDIVKVGNDVGKIHDIGLRATKILTFDHEMLIYPNGVLANTAFINWAQPDTTARVTIMFGVAYGSDVEKVKKTVMKAITSTKGVMKEPAPKVSFRDLGDSALLFKAFFWVEHISERYNYKDTVLTKIYNDLNKAKIIIPFPQRDVHIYDAKR
ncbi:MAG: mechanosensitive ion channel [Nanoarchaeota archaeon]|nr:mechanosensitive ion channel [Nanoarchaeota archaeon]